MGYKATCQCARCSFTRENARLRSLLERSVRLDQRVVDGERVFTFVVGENHSVAEWTDVDGVASDNVFCERPVLEYGVTTTPRQRCLRMVLEMVHWPVLCAMLVGPGDGEFKTTYDQGDVEIDFETGD